MARDFAIAADGNFALDFNKWADGGLITNDASVNINELGMQDLSIFADYDIVCDHLPTLVQDLDVLFTNNPTRCYPS